MIHTPANQWPEPGPAYLARTRYFDFDSEAVRAFAAGAVAGASGDLARAVRLFYAVRDGWRYDPFSMRLDPEQYVASNVLASHAAYCIPKAVLLTAAARAAGIPAAIGFSDVVNHLNTAKLRERIGGKDTFIYHGYAVLFIDGRWVKAAPAFNIELCRRFGVLPTEFDGRSDAIFQPFDARNRKHMEYVRDHGCWSDFPYERIERDFRAFYPASAFADDDGKEAFQEGVRS